MKFLIVGGGLAGITFAHYLRERNIDFKIIDNDKNVSSRVAAGIINPIVFRRVTLSWRLDEMLPFAYQTYTKWEELLNTKFHFNIPIRRFFAAPDEKQAWIKKQELPEYKSYLDFFSEETNTYQSAQNTYGTTLVKNTSYVDSNQFMDAQINFFKEQNQWINADFNHDKFDAAQCIYDGESYDFALFCQGKDVKYCPFFGFLPINQTKGEVLDVRLNSLSNNESLNRKCFAMPIGENVFKIGSTYEWDTDNVEPSEAGKETILNNLKSLTSEIPEIVKHQAGVRPTTLDRRPFLGIHPKFEKLAVFNGLGAKGYMIAPLLAKELGEFLLDDKKLDKEVDIARIKSNI